MSERRAHQSAEHSTDTSSTDLAFKPAWSSSAAKHYEVIARRQVEQVSPHIPLSKNSIEIAASLVEVRERAPAFNAIDRETVLERHAEYIVQLRPRNPLKFDALLRSLHTRKEQVAYPNPDYSEAIAQFYHEIGRGILDYSSTGVRLKRSRLVNSGGELHLIGLNVAGVAAVEGMKRCATDREHISFATASAINVERRLQDSEFSQIGFEHMDPEVTALSTDDLFVNGGMPRVGNTKNAQYIILDPALARGFSTASVILELRRRFRATPEQITVVSLVAAPAGIGYLCSEEHKRQCWEKPLGALPRSMCHRLVVGHVCAALSEYAEIVDTTPQGEVRTVVGNMNKACDNRLLLGQTIEQTSPFASLSTQQMKEMNASLPASRS